MLFAHDTAVSLQSAIWLVNSECPPDTLTTVPEVDDWYARFGYTGRRDGDAGELAQLRALRPMLRTLFTAERDIVADLVNTMLSQAEALPQLVRHGDVDWHLHAVDPESALATRVAVETAMALVDVVRGDELSRFGICAGEDCDGIVLDLTRNRSRRFCSVACGNRNAVAAYRSRRSHG